MQTDKRSPAAERLKLAGQTLLNGREDEQQAISGSDVHWASFGQGFYWGVMVCAFAAMLTAVIVGGFSK